MAAVINHISPALPAKDLPGTMQWYEQKLGFRKTFVYPHESPNYGAVSRDSAEIHFFQSEADPKNNQFVVYMRVAGIDHLYDHCQQHGIVHPEGQLESKPWGQREFTVTDPNGSLLRFGEADQLETE
ncbi:MAG: VOC family protein [Acidobacteriales bacterium]|nr:VOC family protein [Terriglobales bacterium]